MHFPSDQRNAASSAKLWYNSWDFTRRFLLVTKRKRRKKSWSERILWLMSLLIAGSMVVSLIIVALPTGRAPAPTPSPMPFPTITLPPPPTEPVLEPTATVIGPDLPTATPTITATLTMTATSSSFGLYDTPEVRGSASDGGVAGGSRFWQRLPSRGG
jgi:hypothetical protein